MKEVKKQGGNFVDNETDKLLICAYNQKNLCTEQCTACKIYNDGDITTITCLRDSFTFANIIG